MSKNRPDELDDFTNIRPNGSPRETHEYKYSNIELGEFKLVPYNIPLFSFRILPIDQSRGDWDCLGVEWDESGHDFFFSIPDMEC
jgi:hypothetical protein